MGLISDHGLLQKNLHKIGVYTADSIYRLYNAEDKTPFTSY